MDLSGYNFDAFWSWSDSCLAMIIKQHQGSGQILKRKKTVKNGDMKTTHDPEYGFTYCFIETLWHWFKSDC